MDFAQAKVFADNLLSGSPIAGWKLICYHSHGKSAVVMKACRGNETAVIKIFHPGLIEQYGRDAQLIRINRERELIGKTDENIVRILDAGCCEVTGHLFVAMEMVSGKPLSKILDLVPRKNIAILIERLARSAMQLENWGITHRDIKPDNIHVDENMTNLTLLDFGVLKPHGDDSATSLQASKAFVGTHQYSPPEMIHGREENTLDGWRAVTFYQLGAVLHDLIARKPIFWYATARHADLVAAVDNDVVIVEASDVDPHLCNLATRCLLKAPLERLKLVTWEDFFFTERLSQKPTLQERTAELRRRLLLGGALNRVDVIENFEEQRRKGIRLLTAAKSARTQFNQALAALGNILPTRETHLDGQAHPYPAITYSFNAAPSLGLETPFRIQVAVAVYDDRSIVDVYARASKGLTDSEVGWTNLGPALESLDGFSDKFQEWMLAIIEEIINERGV